MKILLTAFDAFGGETVNPAREAAAMVSGHVGDAEIVKVTIPTVFAKAASAAAEAIEKERPDAVLCVGQAGGRCGITFERVAINIDDAAIPDNEGDQPVDRPIIPGGPAAYFSTLPIKAMAAAVRSAGVPADISNSAGTFVCNHLMYEVLNILAGRYPGVKGGFMHVPYIPCQVAGRPGMPSMNLRDIAAGIEAALGVIAGSGREGIAGSGREGT